MSLSRRTVLTGALTAGTLAASGVPALAQPSFAPAARTFTAAKPARIVVLTPRKDVGDVLGLRDFIASSGLSATVEVREVPQASAMPTLLPDIRASKPDLVVTVFTPLTLGAVGRYDDPDPSRFLTDVPVVFTSVTDPVASRVVRALDRPGRAVTGTRHIAPAAVQMKTMLSYRRWKKIAAVYNPAEDNMVVAVRDLKEEAARQGVEIHDAALPRDAAGAPQAAAIPDLIADAARAGAELVYIGPDTLVASNNNAVVAEQALAHRLATFCSTELPIRRANLLMGLVSPAVNVGRFAGLKAVEILTGAKPADTIPVETLNRFSLLLRIGAAKQLDLYPPMRLLNIAEIVQDA
ncbi:ABC transporter substrate-binding protein [Azospirillum brasilense]|uniref:ABC transporter substrate-binding protein n=1 Tax=Azospirillum brasilense TaxID=192 RepID=A0A0P0FAF7_AZOBR|nr:MULTISPECIES: ABC transporter substrate binding protein [Azospirillum]ALJ37094.1 ABC transporter substrate-binding protein [Azospirillum brasilense]MDW7551788.1 ABC transporter substrate binding protein [Azospirillum brasilense]MDW7591223.1 ABC transporter substrate binding protein [Azospirillum brasilense]MDW7626393.1 ABC transporter substrate binding protein [Azospirillum brasilense]MDX5951258.1 ABC transporter substrate binding protein [Azospirillum brasilense]